MSPHNWPQELLSLSKSAVACCNCYWRSLALVPLPEKVVVVMKASFLYKGIQSSRTSGVFSTTNALLPFTAVSCSDMGQMCPSSACSHALQVWDCSLSDRASKKQQQVPDMRRKVMSRSTPAVWFPATSTSCCPGRLHLFTTVHTQEAIINIYLAP